MHALADRNVVLVTLDSCRWDVAAATSTPNLDRLAAPLACETAGSYTLPAHLALFTGSLPAPIRGAYRLGQQQFAAIWRSAAARPAGPDRPVAVTFDGRTVMDDYARRGFSVVGAGGVTFFDPGEANNLLPTFFDQFVYYGRPNRAAGDMDARVVDRDATLALAHVDDLAGRCLQAQRFFLFVNCACTHVPYTTPATRLDPGRRALLTRLYQLHDHRGVLGGLDTLAAEDQAVLCGMQAAALTWADRQLGRLLARLAPARPLVVVCADHGEAFGEDGRYGHGNAHSTVMTVPLWCGLLDPDHA